MPAENLIFPKVYEAAGVPEATLSCNAKATEYIVVSTKFSI